VATLYGVVARIPTLSQDIRICYNSDRIKMIQKSHAITQEKTIQ
jgi:hypothetical protein